VLCVGVRGLGFRVEGLGFRVQCLRGREGGGRDPEHVDCCGQIDGEGESCEGEEEEAVFDDGVDGGTILAEGEKHVAEKECGIGGREDEERVRSAQVGEPPTAADSPARQVSQSALSNRHAEENECRDGDDGGGKAAPGWAAGRLPCLSRLPPQLSVSAQSVTKFGCGKRVSPTHARGRSACVDHDSKSLHVTKSSSKCYSLPQHHTTATPTHAAPRSSFGLMPIAANRCDTTGMMNEAKRLDVRT